MAVPCHAIELHCGPPYATLVSDSTARYLVSVSDRKERQVFFDFAGVRESNAQDRNRSNHRKSKADSDLRNQNRFKWEVK